MLSRDEAKKLPLEYYEGIFEKYKTEDNLERWDDFPETMWRLGFEMDCENSFQEYVSHYNLNLREAHSVREQRRNQLFALEHADKQIVGNYLFSHWRYLTHWSMGYDEYESDYLRRVIAILEQQYKEGES